MDQGKVILDRGQTQHLESGYIVAQYLLKLNQIKAIEKLNTVALGGLKSSHNPTSRLFNWNTVIKEIEVSLALFIKQKLGVKVDPDQKSLVVSGDHECILEVIQNVTEFEKLMVESMKLGNRSISKRAKKLKEGDQPIDIVSLNPDRALNEAESTLEYIIVSLCQALALQPKQAAGLLTNHNHYLLHACIKGVKSNYEQVLNWYQLIYSTSKHLTSLAMESFQQKTFHGETNNQGGYMLLNALKCGLFSESITVAEWACKLFSKIAQDFEINNQLSDFLQWYIQMPSQKNGQLGGGFEATLYSLNKHPQIVENNALLMASAFKGSFDKIIPELKTNHIKMNLPFLPQLLCEILPYLFKQSKEETVSKLLFESGIIQECITQSDPDNKPEQLLRAQSLSLLVEIWSLESSLIQNNENTVQEGQTILESTLKVFKRGCRDPSRPLRISTLGLIFKLLDQFAMIRNNQAPVLYKILTFSLIENIEDEVTREFMMISFSEIYQNHQSIPVSILIEPLLRIMQVNEKQYPINIFDFEFYANLAKHPKLTAAPFGLQLMDQFAKIYLNTPLWAQPASVPFIILADRFQQDPNIQDFLMKFVSITLTSCLSLKKAFELIKTKGKPQQLALPSTQRDGQPLNEEDDHTIKIRRFNIVTITKKILNLKISEEFNEQIKDMILSINRRHKQLYGTMNKGLVHLLEFWFAKGKIAMDEYIKSMDDMDKKQIDDEEKRLAKQAKNDEIARVKAKYYHQDIWKDNKGYFSERDFENQSEVSGNDNSPRRRGSQGGQRALVPWIHKEPKNPIEKKAFIELETIKNKRNEKAFKLRMEEEKKKIKEEKQKKGLKEELNKRKFELGISKKDDSNQDLILYTQPNIETPRVLSSAKPSKQSDIDNMKLLNLENDEEDREKDGVKLLLQKYQKPFKFLFNKYAMSRSQHSKIQSFDYYGDKTINLAEVNKLLRDHDIAQNMINKDQLQAIIRLLNNKLYKRLDLGALDFGAYMQLIIQISHFIYSKQQCNMSPSEMVLKLIQHFEKATRSRGQSTLLYEDPDITSIGDQDVLKEMNRRIKENPDMIIPEGFYKVIEKDQMFNYVLPDYLEIPESYKICIEVLDQLISDEMGFHFLEALVTYDQRIKIKPRIKQASSMMPSVNAGLQYMKPIEKKQFTAPNQSQTIIQQSQPQPEQYKKPQLGVDLKLALYQLQKNYNMTSERNLLQETAEILEEVLQAVENGQDKLPEREKIKYTKDVWNKAKEDKKLKELEERDIEKQREEKRLKRKLQLQEELEKQKDDKKLQVEESKQAKIEREKMEKEKEKKLKEEQKKKYDQRKLITEGSKKVKLDELHQRQQEDEEKKLKEKQGKQKEQKEFMIKQKEKIGQEFQQIKKEKEDTHKAQQEFEEWKKEKNQKVKNQMESYIKQNKDTVHAEAKERQQIKEFYQEPEVYQLFIKFDKALEQLFKFYASQDKKEISFNLGSQLQRVNFNEFIKFGYQTFITPTIVPNDDMVMIFRALVRERRDELTQQELDELGSGVNSLGLEDFKRALIRIAIIGQDLLGGVQGQRLEAKLLEKLDANNGKPPKIATKSRGRSIVSSANTTKRNILQKQNSTAAITANDQILRQQSTTRKTKEQKIIEDIQKEKERQEKQMNIKIEDKRMSKPFDVSIISAQTIEGLLKFIQLQPEDNQYKLDKKLNSQRIEIQGQKPNKLKKSLVMSQKELADLKNVSSVDDGQESQGGILVGNSKIEAVDLNELDDDNSVTQNIVGPDGKQENWDLENKKSMFFASFDFKDLQVYDFRRNSVAYELSNDDYSADFAGDLIESSISTDQMNQSRKLSTMSFGAVNANQILSKRRKRKNRHRKQTNQLMVPIEQIRNMFRSPQLTFQIRNSSKSHTLTPRIKQFDISMQVDKEETNDKLQKELEEEFKQYLDFSENNDLKLQRIQLSPSKLDETTRLFQRHNRFSMHPNQLRLDEDKVNQYPKEQINAHEQHQGEYDDHGDYKNRDQKYQRKQIHRHTKYKYQTHKNQLKKVPHAPHNNNQFLMQNLSKPCHAFGTPEFNQRLTPNFLSRNQSSQQDNNYQQNNTFVNNYESPLVIRDNTFNDLGGSMALVIGSDSFLNDDNFDFCEQKTASENNQDFNQVRNNELQNGNDQIQNENDNEAQMRQSSKKEQIIKEIEQQKRLISRLLKEISDKDKIIKEYNKQKQNVSMPNQ